MDSTRYPSPNFQVQCMPVQLHNSRDICCAKSQQHSTQAQGCSSRYCNVALRKATFGTICSTVIAFLVIGSNLPTCSVTVALPRVTKKLQLLQNRKIYTILFDARNCSQMCNIFSNLFQVHVYDSSTNTVLRLCACCNMLCAVSMTPVTVLATVANL